MNRCLELPWGIEDTILNMKMLKAIISERAKTKNYEGKGETDAKEIEFDFDRAISALEKQIPKKVIRVNLPPKWGEIIKCPSCDSKNIGTKFCLDCGQAIDWRNEDE